MAKINLTKPTQEGIERIIESHPVFSGYGEFIKKHISPEVLKEKAYELYEEAKARGLGDRKMQEYMHEGISDYVAAGLALDKQGRRFILGKGLEEKTRRGIPWFFARRKIRGEKYFDKILKAGRRTHRSVKYDELNEKMPELADSLQTLYNLGYLNEQIYNLRKEGIMNRWKYHRLKRMIKKGAKKEYGQFRRGIEEYLKPVLTSVLMVSGIMLVIFSGLRLTGAVTGNVSNSLGGLLGISLIFISLILFFKSFKKTK